MPTGARPRFSAQRSSASTMAAAPLFRPGALPAVMVPSVAERRPQLRERLQGRIRSVVLVGLERLGPLRPAHLDRDDLALELARRLRGAETLLRAQRPRDLAPRG